MSLDDVLGKAENLLEKPNRCLNKDHWHTQVSPNNNPYNLTDTCHERFVVQSLLFGRGKTLGPLIFSTSFFQRFVA